MEQRRCGVRDLHCGLALLAALGVFVAWVFGLGADSALIDSYDVREVHSYHKAYQAKALGEGRLPLWTPHTFAGWPFAANAITQTFYPPALLGLLLPPAHAVLLDFLLHLGLAGLASYALLRSSYAAAPGAALLGGLSYALCGAMLSRGFAGHLPLYAAAAYVPAVLLCVDRGLARLEARLPPAVGWKQALAIPWTQAGVWPWLGGALVALQIFSGGLPVVALTLLLAGLLQLGNLVAHPQRLQGLAARALVLGVVTGVCLGLASLQLLPSFELWQHSNRLGGGYAYAIRPSLPPAMLVPLILPGRGATGQQILWEAYGYVGGTAFVLALLGLIARRREPRVWVLAAVLGFLLLFALGEHTPLFPWLWKHVPGFAVFRGPARALFAVSLLLALLAGLGLDHLARGLARRQRTGLAGLAVALACGVSLLDLGWQARARRPELQVEARGRMQTQLAAQLGGVLDADPGWYRYWFLRAMFRENHAYAQSARSIGGYDNMMLGRYQRFIHHMADTPLLPELVTILAPRSFADAPSAFPFKILGVKYATYQNKIWKREATPVLRAWFVTRSRRVADEAAALAYLRSEAFEPYAEVVFETSEHEQLGSFAESTPDPSRAAPAVRVQEISPEQLRIELDPHPRGFVVLSEIYYPGWRAQSEGVALPVYRANSILRAVPVEARQTRLEMRYEPGSLRLGSWLSGLSLIGAAGAAGVAWRAGRAPPSPGREGSAEEIPRS